MLRRRTIQNMLMPFLKGQGSLIWSGEPTSGSNHCRFQIWQFRHLHDAFQYFGKRYDISVAFRVSTISDAAISGERLVSLIVDRQVPAFFESSPPRQVKALWGAATWTGRLK